MHVSPTPSTTRRPARGSVAIGRGQEVAQTGLFRKRNKLKPCRRDREDEEQKGRCVGDRSAMRSPALA